VTGVSGEKFGLRSNIAYIENEINTLKALVELAQVADRAA